jgi:hypothetical protein
MVNNKVCAGEVTALYNKALPLFKKRLIITGNDYKYITFSDIGAFISNGVSTIIDTTISSNSCALSFKDFHKQKYSNKDSYLEESKDISKWTGLAIRTIRDVINYTNDPANFFKISESKTLFVYEDEQKMRLHNSEIFFTISEFRKIAVALPKPNKLVIVKPPENNQSIRVPYVLVSFQDPFIGMVASMGSRG